MDIESPSDPIARLRPILVAIRDAFPDKAQAFDIFLRVLNIDAPASAPTAAEMPPNTRTRAHEGAPAAHGGVEGERAAPPRTSSAGPRQRTRPPRAPPPLPKGGRELTPFEYYSLAEVEAFLGVGNQTVRNMLRNDPESFQTKHDIGESGREVLKIKGQSIIAARYRRQKASEDPDASDDESENENDPTAATGDKIDAEIRNLLGGD